MFVLMDSWKGTEWTVTSCWICAAAVQTGTCVARATSPTHPHLLHLFSCNPVQPSATGFTYVAFVIVNKQLTA